MFAWALVLLAFFDPRRAALRDADRVQADHAGRLLVLIPFGLFGKTAFMAERVLGQCGVLRHQGLGSGRHHRHRLDPIFAVHGRLRRGDPDHRRRHRRSCWQPFPSRPRHLRPRHRHRPRLRRPAARRRRGRREPALRSQVHGARRGRRERCSRQGRSRRALSGGAAAVRGGAGRRWRGTAAYSVGSLGQSGAAVSLPALAVLPARQARPLSRP